MHALRSDWNPLFIFCSLVQAAGGEVGGWTLETFSMWLLKKGRRLRECSQWSLTFHWPRNKESTFCFTQSLQLQNKKLVKRCFVFLLYHVFFNKITDYFTRFFNKI